MEIVFVVIDLIDWIWPQGSEPAFVAIYVYPWCTDARYGRLRIRPRIERITHTHTNFNQPSFQDHVNYHHHSRVTTGSFWMESWGVKATRSATNRIRLWRVFSWEQIKDWKDSISGFSSFLFLSFSFSLCPFHTSSHLTQVLQSTHVWHRHGSARGGRFGRLSKLLLGGRRV